MPPTKGQNDLCCEPRISVVKFFHYLKIDFRGKLFSLVNIHSSLQLPPGLKLFGSALINLYTACLQGMAGMILTVSIPSPH
jgi:hypothetical protein